MQRNSQIYLPEVEAWKEHQQCIENLSQSEIDESRKESEFSYCEEEEGFGEESDCFCFGTNRIIKIQHILAQKRFTHAFKNACNHMAC